MSAFGKYAAGIVPSGASTDELARILSEELQRIEDVLGSIRHDFYVMEKLHAAPSKAHDGMVVFADGSDWNPGLGEGLYRYDLSSTSWVFLEGQSTFTYTAPTSVTLNTGTSASSLSDLTTLNDGNTYDVAEVTGSPGYDLEVIFSGLTYFNGFAFKCQYSGSGTHWCEVGVYNYTDTAWDTFITVENSNGQNYRYIEIPDDTDYLSSGAAIIRFYHPSSGNAAHDIYIDYVAILE